MNAVRLLVSDRSGRAVAFAFAANGVAFANWAARIPDVQGRLGLSEGALGLALLGLAAGSVGGMLLTGRVLERAGPGRVTFWAVVAFAVAIVGPSFAVGWGSLFGALVAAGAANGALDMAMNAEGARVEGVIGRPVLSACHGFFSLGALVGAASGAAFAQAAVATPAHLGVVALVLVAAAGAVGRPLLGAARHVGGPPDEPAFAVPRGPLVGLAVVALFVLVGEGAVADWSAVYLRSALDASPGVAGLGYAAFSLAMTAARFAGDAVTERVGDGAVVRWGAALAALGLGLGVAATTPAVAVVGFGVAGLGFAGVVPVLFRAASRAPGVSPGVGIAAVGSAGYFGFLVGPPLVGLVADAAGLRVGLGAVAVVVALAAAGAVPALRSAIGRPARAPLST